MPDIETKYFSLIDTSAESQVAHLPSDFAVFADNLHKTAWHWHDAYNGGLLCEQPLQRLLTIANCNHFHKLMNALNIPLEYAEEFRKNLRYFNGTLNDFMIFYKNNPDVFQTTYYFKPQIARNDVISESETKQASVPTQKGFHLSSVLNKYKTVVHRVSKLFTFHMPEQPLSTKAKILAYKAEYFQKHQKVWWNVAVTLPFISLWTLGYRYVTTADMHDDVKQNKTTVVTNKTSVTDNSTCLQATVHAPVFDKDIKSTVQKLNQLIGVSKNHLAVVNKNQQADVSKNQQVSVKKKKNKKSTTKNTTSSTYFPISINQNINTNGMTLDDYMKHYKDGDRPLTGNDLTSAAWIDFGHSEGLRHYIYQDSKGHPTIGNGHLVIRKDQIYNPIKVQAYKEKFQHLPLMKDGRCLTTDEKSSLYDNLIQNMRRTGKIGNPNQYGSLSMSGMKQVFIEDFTYHYNQAQAVFPDINKYPLKTQLSVIHAFYAGAGNIIVKAISGKTNRFNASLRRKLAPYQGINKSDPEAVQNLILAVRTTRHTARKELDTGKEGLTSTQYAQISWSKEQEDLCENDDSNSNILEQIAQNVSSAMNG